MVSDLPKPVAEVCRFDVDGAGRSTISLVEYAVKKRQELEKKHTRDIDVLWVVFDRDSFQPADFDNAINKCEAENDKNPRTVAAWTNEAFELWFLLHFNYHDTGITREQYKEKLNEAISKASGSKFEYKKNDPNIYWILKKYGNQINAVRFSLKLESMWGSRKDYSVQNPRLKVHQLITELLELDELLKKTIEEDTTAL